MQNDVLPLSAMTAFPVAWITTANEYLQAIAFVITIITGTLYLGGKALAWHRGRKHTDENPDL